MGVTGSYVVAEKAQYLAEVERLVGSGVLHGSESLCRLLRYLAEHALNHPGVAPKEYQIATEIFGRPADFDPHMDSTVRVQAGRLRAKLAEYYASEGADDSIIIDLPKGTYLVAFHHRSAGTHRLHAVSPHEFEHEEGDVHHAPRRGNAAIIALSVLLAMAVLAVVLLLLDRNAREVAAANHPKAPAALQLFWKAFASGPDEPWVIFSNGAFVGRPETGMRYFNPAHDSPRQLILDHYTGVGEVLAVHELDQAFSLLGREIHVKRGTLFSLDEATSNNLIFVGSPAENLTLRDLPSTREFVFQRLTSGPRRGDLAVVNVHPQTDEAKTFLASPSGVTLREDYAVIGLLHGLNPARSVLVLAGTTTMGTQAAVEYVCRQSSLENLLLRLSVSPTGEVKPFEAVLRVKVTRGVPVEAEVVALRKGTQ